MIGLVGAKPGALETRRVGWTLSYGGRRAYFTSASFGLNLGLIQEL